MTRSSQPFLWLLLAAALFMRAVLPQGYMPERSADGSIAVAVCGSDGVHLIPLEGRGIPDDDRPRAEPPCAFAGLGTLAAPLPAGFELAMPAPAERAFAATLAAVSVAAAPRLLPPARGPPLAA